MRYSFLSLAVMGISIVFAGCDGSRPVDNNKTTQSEGNSTTTTCNNKRVDDKYIFSKVANQETPLMEAARDGDLVKVKQLIAKGADVNAISYWDQPHGGKSVIAYALLGGSAPVIKELLDACANPNGFINEGVAIGKVVTKDFAGAYDGGRINPVLIYAISRNMDINIIKMLIRAGADVNVMGAYAYSENKTTPLIIAAAAGLVPIVELLLKAGADKAHKNSDGKTALDYAKEFKHLKVVALLK
ncbi:MAG TPA: ankyrin repeat domain-containing protein [Myxococcota bacterium]|nr:ankyrin repeat domain-containing protein [Myxococcota bacterium]